MSARARIFVAVLGLLIVLSQLPAPERRELSASSFGETPAAHRALFDLFGELGLEPGRSLVPAGRLRPGATIWWVEPAGVCDGRIAMQGDVDVLDPEAVRWPVAPWIEAGGTAVVFLEPPGQDRVRCDAILGHALPDRVVLLADMGEASGQRLADPDSGDDRLAMDEPSSGGGAASATDVALLNEEGSAAASGRAWDGKGPVRAGDDVVLATVDGPIGRREVPAARTRAFATAPDAGAGWEVVATIAAPDAPARAFALERFVGAGRIIVFADSSFLHNQRLDLADAAPLAVDLAGHYGAPDFDERAHGFVAEASTLRYLARSPAMPVFVGLAALGLLVLWHGTAFPARRLVEADDAPTFSGYLRSTAHLYARSGDWSRMAERYRELCASQVRRHFGLPAGVPPAALAERIEHRAGLSRQAAARLTTPGEEPVESEAGLRASARELDDLVREVIR